MISLTVRTSVPPKRTINVDITSTPAQAFEKIGVDIPSTMVRLNGRTLSEDDIDRTFAELNVEDGTYASLSAIVKADGAI